MLAEEPAAMIDIRSFEIDPVRTAGNAAKVEYLHRRWSMGPPPEWVFKPEYFLAEPYYGLGDDYSDEEKQWKRDNGTPEWTKRNIIDSVTKLDPDDILREPLFNPRLLIAHDPVYRAGILERECVSEMNHQAIEDAMMLGDDAEADRLCEAGFLRRAARHLAMIKGEVVYGPTPTLPPYIPRDKIPDVFYKLER